MEYEYNSVCVLELSTVEGCVTYVLLELVELEDLLIVAARGVPAKQSNKVDKTARKEALVL